MRTTCFLAGFLGVAGSAVMALGCAGEVDRGAAPVVEETQSSQDSDAVQPVEESTADAGPQEAESPQGAESLLLPPTVPMVSPEEEVTHTPAPARPDTNQVAIVSLVRGTAEIELKGGRLVPAEHFLVVLEGSGKRFEAITSRKGEFFFDSVPPGRYSLVVFTETGGKPVRRGVTVWSDASVSLPTVRLSADDLVRVRQLQRP